MKKLSVWALVAVLWACDAFTAHDAHAHAVLMKAAPAASARWPPTMPQPAMELVSASMKCMDPPKQRAQPVSLPNSSAMPFSGAMPRASVMPWSR